MEEREKRRSDAESYNSQSCVKALSALTVGERVWVTDTKTSGTVLQNHSTPRSYLVDLPQGVVRRNRSHLIPLHTPTKDRGSLKHQIPGEYTANTRIPAQETTPEQAPVTPAVTTHVSPAETPTLRSRSGRAIVAPGRLNLWTKKKEKKKKNIILCYCVLFVF